MFNFHDKFARAIGIVIVAIIIVAGVFWFLKLRIDNGNQEAQPTPVNKIENFDTDEKPSQFPADLPMESGAKIISNYNATSPEGRLQATQVFESSQSVADNFDLYKSYLSKNGWEILSQNSSNANLRLLIGQNSTGVLNVTIHRGDSATTSVVDLSFVANP